MHKRGHCWPCLKSAVPFSAFSLTHWTAELRLQRMRGMRQLSKHYADARARTTEECVSSMCSV